MHSIFVQISGLVGLFILLQGLWKESAFEHATMTAFGAGLGVYLVLVVVEGSLRRIIEHMPPPKEAPAPTKAPEGASKPVETPAGGTPAEAA